MVFTCSYSSAFSTESPTWVGPADIEFITVQPENNIYVKLKISTPDLGCQGNTDGMLQLDTSAPNFKEQFSLLTAAHMAKRQVTIYVKDCGYYILTLEIHSSKYTA